MCPVFGFNTDIRYGDTVYHVQTEAHESDRTLQTAVFVRGRCVDKQETSYAQEAAQPGFSEGSLHQLLTGQHKFVVNAIREGKFGSLMNMRTQPTPPPLPPRYPQIQPDSSRPAPPPLPVPIPRPTTTINDEVIESAPVAHTTDEDLLGVTFQPAKPLDPPATEDILAQSSIAAPPGEPSAPELKLDWLSSDSVIAAGSARLRFRLTLGSRAIEGAKLVARLEVGRIPSAYARSVTDCEGEAEVEFKLTESAQTADTLSFTTQVSYSGQSVTRRFSLNRKA